MSLSSLQISDDAPTGRKRRTQGERSAGTTSALIEATIACLCEIGYARTTTQEIVRRAGCTTGAMQHHFGSKEDLLRAVLDYLFEEFRSKYASFEVLSGMSIADRCKIILDGLWELYNAPRYLSIWELHIGTRSEPDLHKVCVRHREASVAVCEQAWLTAFSEFKSQRQRMSDLMQFALAMLRSVGLNNALHGELESYRRQLDLLRKFLVAEITDIAASQAREG